jgi:hypothetical protein
VRAAAQFGEFVAEFVEGYGWEYLAALAVREAFVSLSLGRGEFPN